MPGIMINIVSFTYPHASSLLYEGLWGSPFIYKRYPVRLMTRYKLLKELRGEKEAVCWILGGQQRPLSPYPMMKGYVETRKEKRELWIWFNPSEGEFSYIRPLKELRNPWVRLSDILNRLYRAVRGCA